MWRSTILAVALLLIAVVTPSAAVPIVYADFLSDGVTVVGSISQPNGQPANPVGAVYYAFYANAGASVTIIGRRLDGPYDMSFWVLQGLFADTDAFGGNLANLGYIDFGDDQLPPNVPGPFGDPYSSFTAPSSGFYTVAVTNYASTGTPPYSFELTATGISAAAIPEPSALALTGCGVLALAILRRRMHRAPSPRPATRADV